MKAERKLESACRRRAIQSGGLLVKWVSPGWAGVPDRLLLMPGGRMTMIEFKAPGRRLTPLQQVRHAMLGKLGFHPKVIDNVDDFEKLL